MLRKKLGSDRQKKETVLVHGKKKTEKGVEKRGNGKMQHRKMSLQTTEAEKQKKKKRGTYSDARQAIKKKRRGHSYSRIVSAKDITGYVCVYVCARVSCSVLVRLPSSFLFFSSLFVFVYA